MTWFKDVAVFDFETHSISDRPKFPPMPVGVAIRVDGKSRYYAFGHINGANNSTWEEARGALAKIFESGRPLLAHELKFDGFVAEHFNLKLPKWSLLHDTVPMLFLKDPRATTFSLKPSAEAILGEPPTEQDEVRDWLIENQPVPGIKLSISPKSENYWAAYISFTPAEIVGKYAIGDVDRTFRLAEKVYPELQSRNMVEPYNREMRLLPHIMQMERQGVRVDAKRLDADCDMYTALLDKIDTWICKLLKCDVWKDKADDKRTLDSGADYAEHLVKQGYATRESLGITPKSGKLATNKDALANGITDKRLLHLLSYRGSLCTSLRNNMYKWNAVAKRANGLIYCTWNATRQDRDGETKGARTGRFSSTPNFQNIPQEFPILFHHEDTSKGLPKAPFDLPSLPLCRSYIIPWEGETLIKRDYSQQEPRILAHFVGGVLEEAYNTDPWMDVYEFTKVGLQEIGHEYPRKQVKIVFLSIIYSKGLGNLALELECTYNEAKALRNAIYKVCPEIPEINRDMRTRAKCNVPIRTFGGREYFCENEKWVGNKIQTYEYRLLNVLIQGSAGDSNKDAIINFGETKSSETRLILTIHDELVASTPHNLAGGEMERMRKAMEEQQGFDVPMLSEGMMSRTNFAKLIDYDKKGKRCAA